MTYMKTIDRTYAEKMQEGCHCGRRRSEAISIREVRNEKREMGKGSAHLSHLISHFPLLKCAIASSQAPRNDKMRKFCIEERLLRRRLLAMTKYINPAKYFTGSIIKRSFFLFSLILVLLFITMGISYPSQQGYVSRFTMLSPGRITGPAFSDNITFIARDNDGIYRLSKEGKEEGHIELKGSFLDIRGQGDRIYVLFGNDGRRKINVYKSPGMELLKSIPSGDCNFIRSYRDSIIAGCNDGFKLIDSDGNQYRVSLSADGYYIPGQEGQDKKKFFLPEKALKNIFVDGNKIIASYIMGEISEADDDKKLRHYIAVYEGTKRIQRWESPSRIYMCKDKKVFTSGASSLNKINVLSLEGEMLKELVIPEKSLVAGNMVFYESGCVIVFTTSPNHQGMYEILNIDVTTGKIKWKFPVGGRVSDRDVAFIGKNMYVLRNVRGNRYILDRIDLEKGVEDRRIYPGYMGKCRLATHYDFLYITDMKRIKSSKFPSLFFASFYPLERGKHSLLGRKQVYRFSPGSQCALYNFSL